MAQDDTYQGDSPPPGPPGYGYAPPQGYAPPSGYGPPPGSGPPPGYGYPQPGYPGGWRRPTNTMAILSLVMAFVFSPAGIVLGVIARKQIKRTGEEGDGLALAGVIVGSIATAFFLLMTGLMVATFSAAASFGP
jgi:hypothetical protein